MITLTYTSNKPHLEAAQEFTHLLTENKTITVINNYGTENFKKIEGKLVKQNENEKC